MGNSRKAWTRDELLLAMNLYFRLPFGRQHSLDREVVALAERLGRTPGSVAMKLNNLTSLDPAERERGVRGLSGASALDRQVWREFEEDWEEMTVASTALWERVVVDDGEGRGELPSEDLLPPYPTGPTEGRRLSRVRLAQGYFRRVVLAAYDSRCCITGLPLPELLVASHILPWAVCPAHRTDPRNGLCLSRLHDAAFDRGLVTLDEEDRLVLGRDLRHALNHQTVRQEFVAYEGKPIALPERFRPDRRFLERHRNEVFRG